MDSRKRTRVESSGYELEVESINNGGGGGGGDRISGLCNELLQQIFSFLPTREMVQTCVLSKRWRNLWCSVPWLDFDEEAFLLASSSSSSRCFSTFVNYAMLLRDASDIQKLRLSCSSDNTTSSRGVFQYIVVAALKHNLQLLDLKILHQHQADDIDVLPPSLFTCQSLTCLKLNNVVLPSRPSSSICLSSLKTLHLISVKFPPTSNRLWTESLFSNSPILETLTIHNCYFGHLRRFDITAWKLKNLIIIEQDDVAPSSSTSSNTDLFNFISAPNLTSLKLHVGMKSRWYLSSNNSLVEANIHIKKSLCKYNITSSTFMFGVFCELKNAKAITLSGSCLEVIGKNSSVETPFHNLKLMKLTTCLEECEVGAITYLLKLSPNIETLVIEYNSESSYKENELPLREEKLPPECKLPHLKTIQMRGFGGRKNEVKLLTFLLENAKSLEKMIVEKASI